MTVETDVAPRDHAVVFYDDVQQLVASVARFASDGIAAHDTTIVIAAPGHLAVFEEALAVGGVDIDAARRAGFVTIDAVAALSRLVVDGTLRVDRFEIEIAGLIRNASERGRQVSIYGEMVALLWEAGHVGVAIELEDLWNELRQQVPFSLLCAYSADSVSGYGDTFQRLCDCHSEVVGHVQTQAVESFAGDFVSLTGARRFVADTLSSWNLDLLVDDAHIVVSELATNAVLHAQSDFVVAISIVRDSVRLSVRDSSHVAPVLREPSAYTISGRGLLLISTLAERWGTKPVKDGKIVWADLLI